MSYYFWLGIDGPRAQYEYHKARLIESVAQSNKARPISCWDVSAWDGTPDKCGWKYV